MSLEGKVAIVTGASSGIGEAIARTFAEEGGRVAAMARREERLRALADQVPGVYPVPVDLRNEASIRAAFERVERELGPCDVLVNNAGLGHNTGLLDGETDKWREMWEVNVLALCICTREAVAQMRAHDRPGHVVHISSMAGHRVPEESGMYSATKYAVRSLTEGMRRELRAAKSPIRVSAVSPGNVETEFHEHYLQSKEAARVAYGRYPPLQTQDVAATVLHIVTAPPRVQIHDVLVRPTEQPD